MMHSHNAGANDVQSRIDDILVSSEIIQGSYTTVLEATDDSDHLPLLARLDLGATGFIPLEKDVATNEVEQVAPKFVLPMKKEQLMAYQCELGVCQGTEIHAFKHKIDQCLDVLDNALAAEPSPACSSLFLGPLK